MTTPLVLGGASWNTMVHLDAFPQPRPATISNARGNVAAGSTGIGKALALKALGHEPLLHATIGADAEGEAIRAFCAGRGVRTVFDIDPGGTSRHVNLMNSAGERISIFLFNGSPQPPTDVAAMTPHIEAAGTIFLNITQSSVPLLAPIRASNADVWVDLHDYDGVNPWHAQFIAEADVLQLSDEALPDPRGLMEHLGTTARLVICTRGSRGALAFANGAWHEVPPVPARLVDSNGAGDTFMVGTWHALAEGRSLDEALAFAARAAAIAVGSDELVPADLLDSLAAAAGAKA
ncbi:MAG TPA: carbohydrate kinase family protein [Devosia sp.]|jgi:sugar/nucleoside kinase (ribokinase family)|nr:carbohydrate kinase family protein [Devosia sp.]